MTASIRLALLGILLTMFGIEYTWLLVSHFDVDLIALLKTLVLAIVPLLVGLYYVFARPDERVSAMLFGLAFLIAFGPLCTILNNFAVSIAGHRIDDFLARADRSIGIDWPSLVLFVCYHPWLIKTLATAYTISAFQVTIPLLLLGLNGDPQDISRLCMATVVCALATIAFWTILPSFGAFTVYNEALIGQKAHIAIDTTYPQYLRNLLIHGIGHINPANAEGLVGFPSFHTEEIALAVWFMRKQRVFLVPFVIFSIVALASVPIEGGHHAVDVLGGAAFAVVGIVVARHLVNVLTDRDNVDRPILAKAAMGLTHNPS